ncbi:MAG TPA: uroporphyrinogen-III C-methyltransferase [Chitinophagaceae bacterium]|nr:uroporphyrinogen-III C-methyltransferase [Chitinophagaceae bacterium]
MERKLILVGAGPGDPELITLRGIRALREAQVILYDALANALLLDYAQPDALKIFVGKRRNKAAYTQPEIHRLILHYTTHFGTVVRLKGGDPFVFGRGYEELDFARRQGIAVELVPGISSAIALPALLQIPLTLRGMAESFWVTTATMADGSLSTDLMLAARSTATVIILMGLHKITEIASLYLLLDKGNLPVAVVENGSLPGERVITGTMESIAGQVAGAAVQSPALIIAGSVVTLHAAWNAARETQSQTV